MSRWELRVGRMLVSAVAASGLLAIGGCGKRSGGGGPSGDGGPSGVGGNGGSGGQPGGVDLPDGKTYFHAGTRLKPQVLRGGGLEVLDATTRTPWYDTQTGDWCVFRRGPDGVERCFPDVGLEEATYYLDPACKKPVMISREPNCDGRTYHHVSIGPYLGTGCGSSTYRIGEPTEAGNTPIYKFGPSFCERADPAKTIWPLEPVPLDTFVTVQRVRRPALPNMDAWVREGADGSWEIVGFYDPAGKTPCFGPGLAVSSDACVPKWIEPMTTFADSSCTRRAALDNSGACEGDPEIGALLELTTTGDSCSATTTIKGAWQAAAARPNQVFEHDFFEQSCRASQLRGVAAYLQGSAIDVASLPKLEVIQVGTGALTLPFYGFDKVPFYPASSSGPFIEAASGDSCAPSVFADGTWRCVPSTFRRAADYDQFYQSPDCKGDRVYPWGSNGCPNASRQPVGMIVQLFGCGTPVTETIEFEETSSPPGLVYHPTPSSRCEDFGTYPKDGGKLFRATKVINPAERFIPFERTLAD